VTAAASRSCLHCALARALRAEAAAFHARGLDVRLSRSEPVFLPLGGATLYRTLRQLLGAARVAAERSPVKLAVLDLVGKSHVEVTATVLRGTTSSVFSCAFPCSDPSTLAGGFAEHAQG
jgi:hypothetical protein